MIDFNTVKVGSSEKREHNDCAVKALAIAAEIPYDEAHALFKRHGRKNRRATPLNIILKATHEIRPNCDFKNIRKPDGRKYTARTIGEALPKGNYMVLFRGHIAAMVNGCIEDWSDGRCLRVEAIFEM